MSNKKTLLNEGTIRRFMKLADMDNLAESYLDRFEVNEGEKEEKEEVKEEGMHPDKDDEEVKEEGMYAAKGDEDAEEPAMKDLDEEEMELGMDAEEAGDPMDADAGEAGEADEADEALVKKIVTAIAGALKGATGVELSVEGGDEEPDMGDMGAPEEEGGVEEMDADALELDDEAAKYDVMEEEDFDAYIAEVTRRVAKRIIKKKISK